MMKLQNSFTFLTYKAVYSLQDIKSYLIFRVLDPLLLYLFFAPLGAAILGPDYIKFIIIANIIFISARTCLLNLIGMFKNERENGTLGLNIAGSSSVLSLISRRLVIPFLDSLFVIVISFLYAYVLFGVKIDLKMIPALLLIIIVVLFSSSALALIAASISLAFRNVNLFNNLIIGAMQILCGVNFPIILFPNYVQNISYNLPLTNAIIGIRNIIDGAHLNANYHYLESIS
jgi:ABC-2 type transport system permease protein